MADDNIKETDGGLTEQELRLQKEEEEYNRIYVGLISEVEESNIETDELEYTYFS